MRIKRPSTRRVSPATVAAALGADFDHLNLHCCKLHREGNMCEFNGTLNCTGGLSIVMMSDSGHIVLNEEAEATLRNFLARRYRRASRTRRAAQ